MSTEDHMDAIHDERALNRPKQSIHRLTEQEASVKALNIYRTNNRGRSEGCKRLLLRQIGAQVHPSEWIRQGKF